MKLDLHYVDARLVELYDLENLRGADTEFYIRLAGELNAQKILDLGCGTGSLTTELAILGRQVVGVDPSAAMLSVAKRHPNAARVEWREGDSSLLGAPHADLVVMTGNVAQVFLEDSDLNATLQNIHAALRPGGYLAFESRNPEFKEWEQWNREATRAHLESPFGPVECWLEGTCLRGDRVYTEGHNLFKETGEVLVSSSELRFRSGAELTESLCRAGFIVQHVYGDWQLGPVVHNSRVMVFVVRRS